MTTTPTNLNPTTADDLDALAGMSGSGKDLLGSPGDDYLVGGWQDDYIDDTEGHNVLRGLDGNDYIRGSGQIDPGPGDDTAVMVGQGGTYIFHRGDGHDVLHVAHSDVASGEGTLLLGQDISLEQLHFMREGQNLVIRLSEHDSITMADWFSARSHQLADLRTASGEYMAAGQIENRLAQPIFAAGEPLQASKGDDLIHTLPDHQETDAGDGNDTVWGAGTILAGKGDDTIIAEGDADNSIYRLNAGDGHDTLWARDDTHADHGKGVLSFGKGISHDQLWLRRQGDDLRIDALGTGDGTTIKDWYQDRANHVARIESGDGMALSDTRVEQLVQAMAAMPEPAAGTHTLTPAQQHQLALALAHSWQ